MIHSVPRWMDRACTYMLCKSQQQNCHQSVDSVNSRTSISTIFVVIRNDLSSEIISLREQRLCPNIEKAFSYRVSEGFERRSVKQLGNVRRCRTCER
jgi:hypothetical protein